jgi:uncharacterized protein (TIGR02611 family)
MLRRMKDVARLARRIAVTVAGVVILAAGAVLLVTPGPGLLVVLLGLIVLAAEYEWARRHLVIVRDRARSAAEAAAANRFTTASTIAFGAGAVALGVVMIFTDVLPLSNVGTGLSVGLAGLIVLATMAYSIREVRRAERACPGDGGKTPEAGQASRAGDRPG